MANEGLEGFPTENVEILVVMIESWFLEIPTRIEKTKYSKVGTCFLEANSACDTVDGRNPANHLTCMKPWK